MTATAVGHGKTILIGEHHVMDGALALATGLAPFATEVAMSRHADGALRVELQPALDPLVADDTRQMLRAAAQSAGLDGELRVSIASTVPMRRGLGSSAALAVAAVRAAWQLAGRGAPEPSALLAAARACENVVHGHSSGLDPAAAAGQVPLLFQHGAVVRTLAVAAQLRDARWVLVDLGTSIPTRDAIAIAVHRRREMGAAAVAALTAQVSVAAEQAAGALETGDLTKLAIALRSAGLALEPLGVVSAPMQEVLARMRDAGALAAKQTGAGLGGMLLGLCPTAAAAAAVTAAVTAHSRGQWSLAICPEAP